MSENEVEMYTLMAAVAAVVLSVITFIIGERRQKHRKHLEALETNGTLLLEAWRQLASTPKLLRFHSISEQDLQANGLSHDDLSYLIVLFEAADYYYQHVDTETGPFPKGSLRYELLKSPETRKAWPFIRPFFIASNKYVHRIEDTIKQFDQVQ